MKKLTKSQIRAQFKTIRALIEQNVNGVSVYEAPKSTAYPYGGLVVVEPHQYESGDPMFVMYRAEEVLNIANIFRVSAFVRFGEPPVSIGGFTGQCLYIRISE